VEWFDDTGIKICFMIAIASLPLFIASQLLNSNSLLNLRLFKDRNFSIASVITMLTAVSLYGGIYALSLYLAEIQGFSALKIGLVMMWVGVPQIFIMPFIPFLMKKVDLRVLSVVGMTLFAASNFLNTNLNMNYSGQEFQTSLIIRAIGQPLFLIPLSAIGMSMILPSSAGNAASIYNVMRNLGGSIGIALTGTLVLVRERFHFGRYVEHLSTYSSTTTDRLEMIQHYLMASGSDSPTSKMQSMDLLFLTAHREAAIQAFSDVFKLLALCLVFCTFLIFFLKKVKEVKTDGESHSF
jgi:DHA2 family multidrug resistance protein